MSKLIARVTSTPPEGTGITVKGSRLTNTEVDENFLSLYTNKLELGGGTLTGALILHAAPTVDLQAATKKYVDDAVAGFSSAASDITFTPAGSIAATNVQAAIQELDTEKLALAGGTMTGNIFGSGVGLRTLNPGEDHPVFMSDNAYYVPAENAYKAVVAGQGAYIETTYGAAHIVAGNAANANDVIPTSSGSAELWMEYQYASLTGGAGTGTVLQLGGETIRIGDNGWPQRKIVSKFGGSTHSYRTVFQSYSGEVDQLTSVGVIPPPSATVGTAAFIAYGDPNVDSSKFIRMFAEQAGGAVVETGHTAESGSNPAPALTLRSGGTGASVLINNGGTIQLNGATTSNGNFGFSGSARRLTGDMSNSTHSSRLLFQTSTADGASNVGVMPNGTNVNARFIAYGSSDPANASQAMLEVTGTVVNLQATRTGTGAYLPLTFATSGTTRAQIDANGSVGIGFAASLPASPTSQHVLVPTTGVIGTSGTTLNISANVSAQSGWVRTTAAEATLYQQTAGEHAFLTAATGTAGGSVTFTERLRLTANGSVTFGGATGAGVSPGATHVVGPDNTLLGAHGALHVGSNVMYYNSAWRYTNTGAVALYQLSGGAHKFWTANSGTGGNDISTALTEKFRVDNGKTYSFQASEFSGGSLAVYGTSTPSNGGSTEIHYLAGEGYVQALDRNGTVWKPIKVQGSSIQLRPSNNTGFTVHSGTTVSFGNDSVKPWSGGCIGGWYGATAGIASYNSTLYLSSNTYYDGSWRYASTGATGLLAISDTMQYYRKASGTVDNVISGGWDAVFTINATADLTMTGNVTAYSDKRLKEGILKIEGALDKVRKLVGVTFYRKDIEGRKRQMGLLAQDVQRVVPEVVVYDEEKDRYGLAYGNLVALLIEAIKEQDARIDALENAA